MKVTPFACLFSFVSSAALLVTSCDGTKRNFADGTGSGGEGDVATSGGTSPVVGGNSSALEGGAGADGMSPSVGASGAGGQGMLECADGKKLCGGVCVDVDDPTYGCDPTLCTTAGCPEAMGGTLVCDAGECRVGSCGAETKECDGRCVPLTDPTYGCGATTCDASTCPSQSTGATLVCEGSACVIGSCPADYKKCGDKCVAKADPTYGCGATTCDASSCPSAGTGTLVCENSACVVGTCGAGTKKCGSTCVPTDANNGCADPTRCTACASNQACAGTPTTCQCVPTPMATACAGKSCGSVSNGCNGTYTCGSCSSPSAPVCVSHSCRQCSSVSDCPSGTFSCTNNACTCRVANSSNVIQDGGFDSAADLSKWTSSGAVWTNSDADGCPGSGSITISDSGASDSLRRCFQVPVVPAGGKSYTFGLRSKAGPGSNTCFGGTFQDSNCSQGGGLFINFGANESSNWTSDTFTATAPAGTSSISVECQTDSSFTIDQMFLRVSGFTGPGF